jgi:RHS repeat-associated protein
MAYDYMGRRFEYKETVSGTLTRHERYLYRGYLQIAALDMLNSASVKHTIAWDPSEPTATRPLSLQIGANAYYYAFDQVKNVTELFDSTGALAATYDYSPFGQVVASTNNVSNPLTFSSEIHDSSLGLQYYNYRHLNTLDGRWVSRDLIHEEAWENLYGICANNTVKYLDLLGNDWYKKPKDNSHSTGNADDDANNCRGNGPVSSCVVRRVCAKGKKEFKDTFYRPCWLNINGKECVGLEKCRNYIICQEYSIGTSPDPRYTGTMWVNSALPECSECKKTL